MTDQGEFGRIARLFRPLARSLPGAMDLTDDVGFLPAPPAGETLVVTTDTIVEGIHVLPGATPRQMAEKLLRVNLSDLASKGATPLAVLLNTALPHELPDAWLEAFAAALGEDLAGFGAGLLGGDSVSTTGPVTLTLTAIGAVAAARMPRRSGARVGDTVWVSGTLGDGALGLRAARGDLAALAPDDVAWLAQRYHRPQPRLALGRALLGVARAGMDLSDGVPGDIGHICRASGVGARIEAGALPLSDAARRAIASTPALARTALNGGDDYELLFTAASADAAKVRAAGAAAAVPITPIGEIVAGDGAVFLDASGRPIEGLRGWTHF